MSEMNWCAHCDDKRAELDTLREQLEQTRVQLAGCGVAAMCNTHQSREEQKCEPDSYGWSASYQDVVDAVGREIALREERDTLREQLATAQQSARDWAKRAGESQAQLEKIVDEYEQRVREHEATISLQLSMINVLRKELSRYEQAVRVEGFLSSYPLKSTIVFAGNNDIPELRGLDDQAADILIMLKENV